MCAGGRYDGLVEQLGGKATPAVGFAMGMERLVLLLDTAGVVKHLTPAPDCYVVSENAGAALLLAENLRNQVPELRVLCHCGGGKFKKQMKKADDIGARYALILGESEIQNQQVGIKFLREAREQITLNQTQLKTFFAETATAQE